MFASTIYQDFFGTQSMRQIFSDESLVQRWLLVLRTLAEAQAGLGVIPATAAEQIRQAARFEHIDLAALRDGTNVVGRAIQPLLKQIERAGSAEVAEYLHWGGTTQDIMDTATVLQVQEALQLVDGQLQAVVTRLAALASEHRATVMVARTNGQQAMPTTFGLHLAGYMMELHRHRQRMEELKPRVAVGQLGGAVGTLAAMGERGLDVRALLLEKLGLQVPILPWHASRDNLAETLAILGLIHGTLGRIATDISNLSRTEIGEVSEGRGTQSSGASSTMPHKHNPRCAEIMGGLSQTARMRLSGIGEIMAQMDTRHGSPWIVEWTLIPEMFLLTSASLERAEQLFSHLEVHAERMQKNIQITKGFVMSEAVMMHIADTIGRGQAYDLMKSALTNADPDDTLRAIIANEPSLNQLVGDRLNSLLDPASFIGFAPQMVDEAVYHIKSNIISNGEKQK